MVYYHMWYGTLWYIVGLALWTELTKDNTDMIGHHRANCDIIGPHHSHMKHVLDIWVPYHILYGMA